MPQMSPMNWMCLYLYFMIFMLNFTISMFFKMKINKLLKKHINYSNNPLLLW